MIEWRMMRDMPSWEDISHLGELPESTLLLAVGGGYADRFECVCTATLGTELPRASWERRESFCAGAAESSFRVLSLPLEVGVRVLRRARGNPFGHPGACALPYLVVQDEGSNEVLWIDSIEFAGAVRDDVPVAYGFPRLWPAGVNPLGTAEASEALESLDERDDSEEPNGWLELTQLATARLHAWKWLLQSAEVDVVIGTVAGACVRRYGGGEPHSNAQGRALDPGTLDEIRKSGSAEDNELAAILHDALQRGESENRAP